MFRLIVLILVLLVPLSAQPPAVAVQALEIPTGAPVKIKLATGKKIKGKLLAVSSEAVVVQVADRGRVQERTMAFAEIRSIEQIGRVTTGSIVGGFFAAYLSLGVVAIVIGAIIR